MTTLGQSILKNTLLTPLQTRRWLKPATLTSDIKETVGYPWGIRRITLNDSQPYSIITSYNEGGSIGSYLSDFNLIPELGIGFLILIAGDKTLGSLGVATVLGEALLPAPETTARDEAASLYDGTYNNIQGQITITTDPFKPGLGVINWYNDGQNMLNTADILVAGISTPSPTFEARLYPTGLGAVDGSGNKQVSFIANFEDLPYQVPTQCLFLRAERGLVQQV
jgi:hypothetical protein